MDDSVFNALDRLPGRAVPAASYSGAARDNLHRESGPASTRHSFDTTEYRRLTDTDVVDDGSPEQPGRYRLYEHLELDEFDRELLIRPDPNSRQAQAVSGRTRISLVPRHSARPAFVSSYRGIVEADPDQLSVRLGRQDYRYTSRGGDSPSSGIALPSSPAYQASQRHTVMEDNRQYHDQPKSRITELPPRDLNSATTRSRPVVQGIQLVAVSDLPDRVRALFPFACFNAVQSRCFSSIYTTDHNFVLSSPTGSGKTVIFELAICRLVLALQGGTFKVVYMAPTKALCAERKRDWKTKFSALGLQCEEMTGDSDIASLHNVQTADIIVTTPEKWDSMTRKWKDHVKLVRIIKLFLIDEVHILGKDRGATLEAVVSRMKSVGSNIRFVALSATVPNFHDVATWLGRDSIHASIPAIRERFGEEFRPVKLQKHVCGYQTNSNAFAFDSTLNKKLPDVIAKYSQQKPIMIFCFTRKSCSDAAKFLTNWWTLAHPNRRFWPGPQKDIRVDDKDLRSTVQAGVAVHHGGLCQEDRIAVEKAYLEGELHVICCTSTLSVGVNLPCHMAIIKNTCTYEGNATKEYSDLEIMQLIGRAGRPQFDDSAIAVIMTRLPQVAHYEQMISGQEQLESCLHLNLVEHMNAEIGLGTINDIHSAKRWLQGTFLRVRLQENPRYYKIDGDTAAGNLDERLEKICTSAVSQLTEHDLVKDESRLRLTEYGEAMARYYVNIDTMIAIIGLPKQPKPSEILSTLAQANEFREIRLRAGEKGVYKQINESPSTRFPIKINLALPAHKVTLIIQCVLGGVEGLANDSAHRTQYGIDQGLIFQHINRLIRCIIDCSSYREDAVGIRNALLLSRSFAAKVWDDSPLILRQIDQIGPVAVKKLVAANINNFEDLEHAESGLVERALGKNPAFVHRILANVKTFPKLRVCIQTRSKAVIKHGEHVTIDLAVELGFINDKTPMQYQKKPIFVVMLAETSDGRLLHFCRISAQKLARAAPVLFTAQLKRPTQFINCYAMCDELAGTMKQVRVDPQIPANAFQSIQDGPRHTSGGTPRLGPRDSAQLSSPKHGAQRRIISDDASEAWGDGGIDDLEFVNAAENDTMFADIDEVGYDVADPQNRFDDMDEDAETIGEVKQPVQLRNGKWACNHACKDKTRCKHMCCRDGLDKKPKPKKAKIATTEQKKGGVNQSTKTQSKLDLKAKKKEPTAGDRSKILEHIDLTRESSIHRASAFAAPSMLKGLGRLHEKMTTLDGAPGFTDYTPDLSQNNYYVSHQEPPNDDSNSYIDDGFDESLMDDLPDISMITRDCEPTREPVRSFEAEDVSYFDGDQEMLDAVLIGAEDSNQLQSMSGGIEDKSAVLSDLECCIPITQGLKNDVSTQLSEPTLFLPLKDEIDTRPPGTQTKHQSTRPRPEKRKTEDENEFFCDPKRSRYEVDDIYYESTTNEDCQAGRDQDISKPDTVDPTVAEQLEKAKLKAWLFSEFGGSVELVESMDYGNE